MKIIKGTAQIRWTEQDRKEYEEGELEELSELTELREQLTEIGYGTEIFDWRCDDCVNGVMLNSYFDYTIKAFDKDVKKISEVIGEGYYEEEINE